MFCQTKIQIGLEEERLSFENDWNDDWNDVSLLAGLEEPTTRDVLPDHIHIGEGSRMRPAEVINRASTSKKSSLQDRVTAGVASHDHVQFIMHSPQLEYPISLPFMPPQKLTVERILAEIERVWMTLIRLR